MISTVIVIDTLPLFIDGYVVHVPQFVPGRTIVLLPLLLLFYFVLLLLILLHRRNFCSACLLT